VAVKRLEFLREAVPSFRRLGILFDDSNSVNVEEAHEVQPAAAKLGVETFPVAIRCAEDIVPVSKASKSAPMPFMWPPARSS
jgi:ABC-type uncharacterized transport system substrate-binding protein